MFFNVGGLLFQIFHRYSQQIRSPYHHAYYVGIFSQNTWCSMIELIAKPFSSSTATSLLLILHMANNSIQIDFVDHANHLLTAMSHSYAVINRRKYLNGWILLNENRRMSCRWAVTSGSFDKAYAMTNNDIAFFKARCQGYRTSGIFPLHPFRSGLQGIARTGLSCLPYCLGEFAGLMIGSQHTLGKSRRRISLSFLF